MAFVVGRFDVVGFPVVVVVVVTFVVSSVVTDGADGTVIFVVDSLDCFDGVF